MKKINFFYIFIASLFSTLLIVNSFYFKGSSSFLGVTYARAYKINAEKSGLIKTVKVVSGQEVEKGELLAEIESPELSLTIQKLKKEILLFESEIEEKEKLFDSKIQLFESEKTILRNDTESEIRLLENERDLNRTLVNRINTREDNPVIEKDSLTSLQLQIKAVRDKGALELKAVDIRLKDTEQEHEFDISQIRAKIELAQEELNWKLIEQERLNKYASFSGVIENVYVKEGEEVEAFTSLLSINPKQPTSVVGYLVGKKERDKKLGDSVTVVSLEQPSLTADGRIIGFGAVVELPGILEKDPTLKTFGLEIFIEIPDNNNLAVGEKIIVK